jgi:adenine C2-methylase RlmN of 23S rRNA A2503 and tRNA A37
MDGSQKFRLLLSDGEQIEMVLMPEEKNLRFAFLLKLAVLVIVLSVQQVK